MSFFESTLLNCANPCRNWTFQRFARVAEKKERNGTNEKSFFSATLAKRWKVQFRQGFAQFNNVDSKTTSNNDIAIYIYIIYIAYLYIFYIFVITTYFFNIYHNNLLVHFIIILKWKRI